MAGTFVIGETKKRPGVYSRYENSGGTEAAGAINGIGAAVIQADWGPLNQMVTMSANELAANFGSALTTGVVTALFDGGCSTVKAVRVGTGGTKATITLKDDTAAAAVTIESKYVGARAFTVTIRDSLTDTIKRECIIYDGTKEFEKVTFAKGSTGDGEPAALVAAMAASSNFTATKVVDGSKALAAVSQTAMTAGTNPTVTTSDYSTAMNVLEAGKWNVLVADTTDTAVHALVQAFIDRIYQTGNNVMTVLAEAKSTPLDTRMSNAAAFNDEKIIYVLNSAYKNGTLYDGYLLAALIGGYVAAVSSSESLTHTVIKGFTSLAEALTNTQIETALGKGCIVLSVNSSGQIWIESAINTLIIPTGNQDPGWKKIRRTKTRFELMSRITDTCEALTGKINNDTNGRATCIAAAQGVINDMIGEKKIIDGSVKEDASNPAAGDSAWFLIAVDDIDSIEKSYMVYRFRFAAETATE